MSDLEQIRLEVGLLSEEADRAHLAAVAANDPVLWGRWNSLCEKLFQRKRDLLRLEALAKPVTRKIEECPFGCVPSTQCYGCYYDKGV